MIWDLACVCQRAFLLRVSGSDVLLFRPEVMGEVEDDMIIVRFGED